MTETSETVAVPPFLLRGLARGIDLGVQIFIMDAAFRVSAELPVKGLLTLPEATLLWIDLGVGLSALLLYTAIAEWVGAATLGKLATGLRVVMEDGRPLDLKAALIRNGLFFIDGLFLGLIAYSAMSRSERGQRVGDQVAGTLVVWRRDAARPRAWLGWAVGVGVAASLVVLSYVLAA